MLCTAMHKVMSWGPAADTYLDTLTARTNTTYFGLDWLVNNR